MHPQSYRGVPTYLLKVHPFAYSWLLGEVAYLVKEILLIEDSDADALLVERALEAVSVANPVHRVNTGEDAMVYLNKSAEAAAIGPPPSSILFIDLVLPGISGLQILENTLGRPEFSKTLRIVLSNLTHAKAIQRAYTLGAHTFLSKPVQPADLRQLIENFPGYWSFNVAFENPFRRTLAKVCR